jgi:hypothetical protein
MMPKKEEKIKTAGKKKARPDTALPLSDRKDRLRHRENALKKIIQYFSEARKKR